MPPNPGSSTIARSTMPSAVRSRLRAESASAPLAHRAHRRAAQLRGRHDRLAQHGTTLVSRAHTARAGHAVRPRRRRQAHVERQLAQNEQFRENAASAASAGIEYAISPIVTRPPVATDANIAADARGASCPASTTISKPSRVSSATKSRCRSRRAGLAGAHFEIISTGYSRRRAIDRQRATSCW